jgi:hypothetical protein
LTADIRGECAHTTYMVRNKQEKLEGKFKTNFDIPFMIQSLVENMKKIMGVLLDLPAN